MSRPRRPPFLRPDTLLPLAAMLLASPAGDAYAASPTALETSVAHADVTRGHAIASAQCGICHSFGAGGPSLVGPNLYAVVGRPIASVPGYGYSSALSAKKGVWTVAALDGWLAAPMSWAPGTKMGYAGLSDPESRAEVIAYLQSLGMKAPSR